MQKLADKTESVESELRRLRLWYHDVEVAPGLRTRFEEDYDANPVLRSVDECGRRSLALVDEYLPADLSHFTIVDIGCADGLIAVHAARRGAARVIGIERNRNNFDRAALLRRILNLGNLELRWGCAEKSLGDEPFDFAICLGLIYHLVDPLGTLHAIRSRCRRRLILTSAIDLEDGDGEPLQRLDRYATGGHGLWAFNVPMVRQMLSTAGFEVVFDRVESLPGGRQYVAIADPGSFSTHHIFDERIDQAFPIDLDQRRREIRDSLSQLVCEIEKPAVLFGAGTHTAWLLEQTADIQGLRIDRVLDDRIPVRGTVGGLPVISPMDVDEESLGAVIVSSWHQSEVLRRRAGEVFGDRVRIITFGDEPQE